MWKFVIMLAFSTIWALKASEEFGNLKKHKTGCNSSIVANNSAFNLDLHNLSKPCYWNITSKSPGPISLFFSSLFLHEEDELNIYKNLDDAENGTNPLTEESIHAQNGTLTVITKEIHIVLMLIGNTTEFDRIFEGYYSVNACSIPVPPEVEILHSPTYLEEVSQPKECIYRFNEIPHKRVIQVFSFQEFNMSSSSDVKVEGGTFSGDYTNSPPTDFFIDDKILTLTAKQALNSTDHFTLRIHEVDKDCSGKFSPEERPQLISPSYVLNNGSIESECRWLITSSKDKILGLKFDNLDFHSVFDIVAVNDGLSEFSLPLLQVTTSNRNSSKNQMVRASGSSLWVSFKPLSYKSSIIANISKHGQGGYFKNGGTLTMHMTTGDDTVFLLEVDDGKVVELTSEVSTLLPPATLSVYDGFDTSSLLTSLHGQIKFPILSRSSRMMIIGTNFSAAENNFKATFQGIIPGCNHMSSMETENYVLSENCNSTCKWIIPPQDSPNSVLVVNLQYISLQNGDKVKIQKLDASLTELGKIDANETHVPHFTLPANVGTMISVTQGACKEKKDRIVLIGHSSYIPGCSQNINSASGILQISSPLYPDTYPVFANCLWNISTSKEAIVHMAFQSFNLAENHCVKVSQKSGKTNQYEGEMLPPDDLFLLGDVLVEFDSTGCNNSTVGNTLKSDLGFLLNVTITDCGALLDDKKSSEFNTSITGNKSICIWKVTVPPKEGDSVNIVSYVVSKKDSLENFKLHVYDGTTVRDSKIDNNTNSDIWSRTNTLIFVYQRLNVSQPSSVLVFKYNTISCNISMQCDNKICMHPDWRCNSIDDCGDFSDERGCGSVPIPPTNPVPIKYTGYSATAFWLCIIAMMMIGVILGLTVPVCYQKYKDSRYRRFHELEG